MSGGLKRSSIRISSEFLEDDLTGMLKIFVLDLGLKITNLRSQLHLQAASWLITVLLEAESYLNFSKKTHCTQFVKITTAIVLRNTFEKELGSMDVRWIENKFNMNIAWIPCERCK